MVEHPPPASPPGMSRGGEGNTPGVMVRSGFALALGLLAAVIFVSARSSSVTPEERIGARVELAELIRAQQVRADELKARVDELALQVEAFEEAAPRTDDMLGLQVRIDEMAAPAGLTPVHGPGLVVSLNDSAQAASRGVDANDLVIHEQDLHAVINALWAGGAEAMSVNGQRVLATTAVRCVGSVLLLHGRTYSPPYVIRAVGDEEMMQASLRRDDAVQRFAAAAKAFQLGYSVSADDELELPAYEGTAALQVARPAAGA